MTQSVKMRGAVIILYFAGMNNYVHSTIDECWLISFVISNYQILLSHNSIKAIIKWHLVSLFSIRALATRYLSLSMHILGFLIKTSSENATHKMQPKIIGGQPIDIKYRPFMVNIIFYLYLQFIYFKNKTIFAALFTWFIWIPVRC